jgi:Protein kinase domain
VLQPGDSLAGYRIEMVAGVGGMGVVYRAIQTSLDRPVALKVLSSTLVGNRTFRERFRREGRHAAALDHPNIIPVYEAGESNGLMFIAMRLVDGPSLADLIDRRELSGREGLRVLSAIAGALDAAHDAGLVHRDIKPQNILLTRQGHPYLADFGITKGSDHAGLTHSGDFVGSLNYVAPEQIEGREVGGASDIYALTAVLFQVLSGAYPYQRDTDAALMHAHLTAPPPTFADRDIRVPRELDEVVRRGMAKDPAERFPDAGALMRACADALRTVDEQALAQCPPFPAPDAAPRRAAAAPPSADTTRTDALGWADPPADRTPAREAASPVASADVTSADLPRREPAAPQTSAPTQPRGAVRMGVPSWLAPASAVVVLAVAGIGGYVLGHRDGPPPPARAASAAVAVAYGAEWSTATGSIDGVALEGAVALRSAAGAKLVAGRVAEPRATFDPLPRGVASRLAEGAERVDVRIGERQFVRTKGTLENGDELWAAFTPDTRGWTGLVCTGPQAQASCPAVAATLRTTDARPVGLGPRAATIDTLAASVTALGKARRAAEPGLAAKRTAKRAAAARTLAAAHTRAAAAVRKAPDPWEARYITVLPRLAADLTAQASAISRLARAAAAADRAGYVRARESMKARERRVADDLDRLGELGYLAR